jgi:hypothetical protein
MMHSLSYPIPYAFSAGSTKCTLFGNFFTGHIHTD